MSVKWGTGAKEIADRIEQQIRFALADIEAGLIYSSSTCLKKALTIYEEEWRRAKQK